MPRVPDDNLKNKRVTGIGQLNRPSKEVVPVVTKSKMPWDRAFGAQSSAARTSMRLNGLMIAVGWSGVPKPRSAKVMGWHSACVVNTSSIPRIARRATGR